MRIYVHCNPITHFDAWGLETENESEQAARDWYADNPNEDQSFEDWYSDHKDWWYGKRADEGYTIYNNKLDTIIKEGNADARKNLFSSSAATAKKETIQRLDYETNSRLKEAAELDEHYGYATWKSKELKAAAWDYDKLRRQLEHGKVAAFFQDLGNNPMELAFALDSVYSIGKLGVTGVRSLLSGGDDALRVLSSSIDDITDTGSRYLNRATNVSRAQFEKNLMDSGFTRTISKDGKVSIFQKDGAKYVVRDGARSTGGPTADYYKSGSSSIDIKIRLDSGAN